MSEAVKPGRPKLQARPPLQSTVTFAVTREQHDRLVQRANQERTSVSSLVRRIVLSHQ